MTLSEYPPVQGASGIAVDRQTFSAPTGGTWTKPTGATLVRVQLVGGGGGGAGGNRGATGTTRSGGGGGAAGTYAEAWYQASDLPATMAVAVGSGGTGGAGATGPNTFGGNGALGSDTTFGSILRGAAPYRASSGQGTPIAGRSTLGDVGLNTAASALGAGQANSSTGKALRWGGSPYQPGGGASGQQLTTANVLSATGADGVNNLAMDDGANLSLAGVNPNGSATPPTSPKTLAQVLNAVIPWYSGGGGAAGLIGTGATGGTGGNGGDGFFGAGGGGGGPGTNPDPAGIGGRGGDGVAIITSF